MGVHKIWGGSMDRSNKQRDVEWPNWAKHCHSPAASAKAGIRPFRPLAITALSVTGTNATTESWCNQTVRALTLGSFGKLAFASRSLTQVKQRPMSGRSRPCGFRRLQPAAPIQRANGFMLHVTANCRTELNSALLRKSGSRCAHKNGARRSFSTPRPAPPCAD
jgi:hypothetical protein